MKFAREGEPARCVSGTILQKDAPQDLVTSVPVYAVVCRETAGAAGASIRRRRGVFVPFAAPPGTHKIVLDPNETVLTSPK